MKINNGPRDVQHDDANIIGIPYTAVAECTLISPDGQQTDLRRLLANGCVLDLRFLDHDVIGVTDWLQIGNEQEIESWRDISPAELMRFRLQSLE